MKTPVVWDSAAVFVDDDGRVYGYWGFGHFHGARLDLHYHVR